MNLVSYFIVLTFIFVSFLVVYLLCKVYFQGSYGALIVLQNWQDMFIYFICCPHEFNELFSILLFVRYWLFVFTI